MITAVAVLSSSVAFMMTKSPGVVRSTSRSAGDIAWLGGIVVVFSFSLGLAGGEQAVNRLPLPPFAGAHSLNGAGAYMYMGDLQKMDACRPSRAPPIRAEPSHIATPLRTEIWKEELRAHSDQVFAQYLVRGLEQGFRIGYRHSSHRCVAAKCNMVSALQHPEPIEAYLSKEVGAGRPIYQVCGICNQGRPARHIPGFHAPFLVHFEMYQV